MPDDVLESLKQAFIREKIKEPKGHVEIPLPVCVWLSGRHRKLEKWSRWFSHLEHTSPYAWIFSSNRSTSSSFFFFSSFI